VRSIRIESTTGEPIQIFELQAYTTSGLEVATGKVATQSLTFKDDNVKFGASNAVDGNNFTFSHLNDASSIWEVDLAGDYGISYTSIQNRWCGGTSDNSNCLCRLSNAKLSLLDVQGEVVSSVSVGNTCGTLTVKNDFEYTSRPAVSACICMYLLCSSLNEPNRAMFHFSEKGETPIHKESSFNCSSWRCIQRATMLWEKVLRLLSRPLSKTVPSLQQPMSLIGSMRPWEI
jgi:hypothetical protein